MLIMRRGRVMSSGEGLEACESYAKVQKTRVKEVEVASTLGGFYELVVRWTDRAIGIYWTHDRTELRAWLAGRTDWPRPVEYAVQVLPSLLDPPPAPDAPEQTDEEVAPLRIRRTPSTRPALTMPAPAPKPAPKPVEPRITRRRGASDHTVI